MKSSNRQSYFRFFNVNLDSHATFYVRYLVIYTYVYGVLQFVKLYFMHPTQRHVTHRFVLRILAVLFLTKEHNAVNTKCF